MDEKKLIIRELALASSRRDIIGKLNEMRKERNLPALEKNFDVYHYKRQYGELIEDVSLHFAKNIAKIFRFAGRVARIAQLNAMAEELAERIESRRGKTLGDKTEQRHNQNMKLLREMLNAVDQQMGQLKLTRIDVNVRKEDKPSLENPEAVRDLIADTLKNRFTDQLPASVDANFSEVTDFEKCDYAEEWKETTHCQFHHSQCKVETGEISLCPHFINKVLLSNKDWLARRYVKDHLSLRQIAEIAGCKEIDDRVIERVRGCIKRSGITRASEGTDS